MTVCELSYESTVLYLLIAMVCFVGSTNALVVVMLSTGFATPVFHHRNGRFHRCDLPLHQRCSRLWVGLCVAV